MVTLQDFQTQVDSINASLASIVAYIATLSGGLNAADAATALAGITDAASKLATVVPIV